MYSRMGGAAWVGGQTAVTAAMPPPPPLLSKRRLLHVHVLQSMESCCLEDVSSVHVMTVC